MNLFAELKRRNVFKVAIAYAIVGWVLMQIAAVAFPPLGLPEWSQTFVVVLVLMGLPIAILLAWAFEITPDGVKQTKKNTTSPYGVMALTFAIMAVGAWYYLGETPNTPTVVENLAPALPIAEDKSIAVLPFVDMSAASDQEYLGDGITEEILNVLVRSRELRVVGRTSSFAFKGLNQDLRAIGEALGVAYILEGSVRKADNRVRVTAQLVKASDGFHLWSQTYDRTIDENRLKLLQAALLP